MYFFCFLAETFIMGVNTAGGDVGAEVAKKVDKVLVLEHSLLLALAKHLLLLSLLSLPSKL